MSEKTKVLILTDWFEPGVKAGGPIRSLSNFVKLLKDDLELSVITSDRDLGDKSAYIGIVSDEWITRDGVRIYYCSPGMLSWKNLSDLIIHHPADHIYLNGMFSIPFTIYPLLMHRLGKIKASIVLAPRGMLKNSALSRKKIKKALFNRIMGWGGFFDGIVFQATDPSESNEIRALPGKLKSIVELSNIPIAAEPYRPPPPKVRGCISLVFIGRIHPVKNLEFLIKLIGALDGQIMLTIVGPLEDQSYWLRCKDLISKLPLNIGIKYLQQVPNDQIKDIIFSNHIFVLLTEGENFGHAIVEAMACSRPVLISDRTPWCGLESLKAGWDLPLEDHVVIQSKLKEAISFSGEELEVWCRGSFSYISRFIAKSDLKNEYLKLFAL
jgi:glycosyltransferase involved in cell wall biosynthesis